MNLEEKHMEHIAKMHAVTDGSWSSWAFPVGLGIWFISLGISGVLLAVLGVLIKYIFILK